MNKNRKQYWEQFFPHANHPNLGTIASIYLNKDKTLIKRQYVNGALTCSGNFVNKKDLFLYRRWKCEVTYMEMFQGMRWVPKLVSYNETDRSIVMEYYGPDLLQQSYENMDIEEQIIEVYKHFKDVGVYKYNGAKANMSRNGNQLIVFDFKWMTKRRKRFQQCAKYEIDNWLSKINPDLVPVLKEMI